MLKNILPQYGLWYIAQGFKQYSHEYFKHIKDVNIESPEDFKAFVEFVLPLVLEQIEAINQKLNNKYLYRELTRYIDMTRFETSYPSFPKHSELITKELLIRGEVARGDVKEIINREQRSATKLIKDLMDLEYIKSDSPKGNIRLNFPLEIADIIFH
jgi:Fic family protein